MEAHPGTLVAPPKAHTFGFRRVTGREISLFLRDDTLTSPGGIAVVRLAATNDPGTTGDDDEVTVVALDSHTGKIFTNFGLLKAGAWSGEGTEIGPLRAPRDVALDKEGRVAVTDPGNRRVVLLRHDGSALTPVRAFGGFLEPTGIAADGRGGFYVCDRRFNTVFHLNTATGERATFGLEVAFDRPVAIATVPAGDTLARGRKRMVVIVDQDGARLRSFDVAGSLRSSRLASSIARGDTSFDDVEIDFYGNIYAVDRLRNALHKLRDDLYPLDMFGERGTDVGNFLGPRGIAIHRRLGQVFVTEEDGGQYLWVGTDVKKFQAEDHGATVGFSFVLTEESVVHIRILDTQGHEVARIVSDQRHTAGPQQGTWDGTNEQGTRVRAGDYLAEIRARATYASRSTFERKVLEPFTIGISGNGP